MEKKKPTTTTEKLNLITLKWKGKSDQQPGEFIMVTDSLHLYRTQDLVPTPHIKLQNKGCELCSDLSGKCA